MELTHHSIAWRGCAPVNAAHGYINASVVTLFQYPNDYGCSAYFSVGKQIAIGNKLSLFAEYEPGIFLPSFQKGLTAALADLRVTEASASLVYCELAGRNWFLTLR